MTEVLFIKLKSSRKKSEHSYMYKNEVDKDYKKLAFLLLDLLRFGFPIDKAIKEYKILLKKEKEEAFPF